ncbi:MAG: MBL fold metallo-hydrolase [Clostridia bacterium]|nr:MBL fold metallo-hydrolase [Clostridia bacterium]
MFSVNPVLPGIYHIRDAMGVCMTLLTGTEKALLIDTGYGTEDVRAFVSGLTEREITVLLTHGHHDHAVGARWFDKTYMFAEDLDEFRELTGPAKRAVLAEQAAVKGLSVPEDWMTRAVKEPEPLHEQTIALGGMSVRVMHVPGHTPGSFVAYIPEHRLLLSGDDWNPCTWIWFPSAEGIGTWRANMKQLYSLPFTHVLCSHQPDLRTREELVSFVDSITDEAIAKAEPVDMGSPIDTRVIRFSDERLIVFDHAKA